MSKKTHTKSEGRVYTTEEINRLLNSTRDEYRLRRLELMRKFVSTALTFYSVVIVLVLCVYLVDRFYQSEKNGQTTIDSVQEPRLPRVAYAEKEGRMVPVYDQTDFSPSIEEQVIARRLEDISVSLFDISIPKESVSDYFTTGNATATRIGESSPSVLRFRVVMKSGDVVEVALPRWGHFLMLTRSKEQLVIPINAIKCFRGALSGPVYKEDVEIDLQRRGVSSFMKGCVASEDSECMKDIDAQRLFYIISVLAEDTRFDWGAVTRVLTFGIWNQYHPVLSLFTTLVLALLMILVKKKVFNKR